MSSNTEYVRCECHCRGSCMYIVEEGGVVSLEVPQYILERSASSRRKCRIVVTQPRRLSTIAVAERAAVERGERIGDTVGYHIRLEKR